MMIHHPVVLLFGAALIIGLVLKTVRDQRNASLKLLKDMSNYAIAMLLDDLDRKYQRASLVTVVLQAKPQDEDALSECMVRYIHDLATLRSYHSAKYCKDMLWKNKQGTEA